MIHGTYELEKVLPGQRLVMFQFVEHHRIIHIEHDVRIDAFHQC